MKSMFQVFVAVLLLGATSQAQQPVPVPPQPTPHLTVAPTPVQPPPPPTAIHKVKLVATATRGISGQYPFAVAYPAVAISAGLGDVAMLKFDVSQIPKHVLVLKAKLTTTSYGSTVAPSKFLTQGPIYIPDFYWDETTIFQTSPNKLRTKVGQYRIEAKTVSNKTQFVNDGPDFVAVVQQFMNDRDAKLGQPTGLLLTSASLGMPHGYLSIDSRYSERAPVLKVTYLQLE